MKTIPSLILLCLLTAHGYSQVASTFDTDADGWTFYNASNVSNTVVFHSTSGNPGGYISATYASNQNGAYQFWHAPSKFHGDHLTRSLGMNIKFDLQQSQAGIASNYDIRIWNGSDYIYYVFPTKPAVAPSWTSYSLKLDETFGWYYSSGAVLATRTHILSILTNVTNIEIRGTYGTNVSYTSGLDNVVLEQRNLTAPPVASSLSSTSGKPGATITINGSGFDPVAVNNVVRFGAVTGNITNATANQLTVTIPVGAQYGKLTITNKTTGLSATSQKPFNPVFDGGGRIVRDSFKPKIDILLTTDLEGITVRDIDSDGWADIAVASSTAFKTVDIYRNLGQTGDITTANFAPKITVTIPGTSTNYTGVEFTDLDGDGKLDLSTSNVLVNFGGAYFMTYRNISTPGNIAFEAVEYWAGLTDDSPPSLITDLDGDGRPELIGGEGSYSTGAYFWVAQNISMPGNIEFGASVGYFIAGSNGGFGGASAGDLDNDGKPELLVAHGDRFSIFKNNSTIGVISMANIGMITSGQYIATLQGVDFNLDGKNDLIWKNTGGSTIYIRPNSNTGAALAITDFTTEVTLAGDLSNYGGFSIADINGDGKPDIADADNGDLGIFENRYSSGVFDAGAFIPAYSVQGSGNGSYPYPPIAADLNGDGKPELILGITNTGTKRISIFENKNIHAPVISMNTIFPLQGEVGSTVTITGNNFSTVPSENSVWFGAVEATVLTATANELTVEVPAGATYGPVSVIKANFTSQYHLPFNPTFGAGVVFDNTHFSPSVNFTLTTANYDIDIADLDRDGMPDIVAEGGGNTTVIFRNAHTTGPINTSSLVTDGTAPNFFNPKLADMDGDGYKDLLTPGGRILKNNSTVGDISFLPEISTGLGADGVGVTDLNLDGKTDAIFTTPTSATNNLMVIENRSTSGAGNFIAPSEFSTFSGIFYYGRPGRSGSVATADFDKDGFPDVAATSNTSGHLNIFRNTGSLKVSATQFARVDIVIGNAPYFVYAGDLDVDGKMDIVVCYYLGSNPTIISIFHNQSTPGNMVFNRFDIDLGATTVAAAIADMDGDGLPEILAASEFANRFSILKNIHTGGALTAASFAAPFHTTSTGARGIMAADLNLDGKPEIIISGGNQLRVYENLIPTGPTISIDTQPTFTYACEGSTATFNVDATGTTNITYRWQFDSGSGFTDLNDGSGYTGTGSKTLSINTMTTGFTANGPYRCKISGDLAPDVFTNSAQLTINSLPSPPDVTGGTECTSPSTVTLTATGTSNGNYNWYDVATGGSLLGTNGSFTTPAITATKTYYVSIKDSFCESDRVAVDATITLLTKPTLNSSAPIVSGGINICDGEDCTLTAPTGFITYTWSNGDTDPEITVDQGGVYTVIVEDAKGCVSPASDPVTVIVNPFPPAIITVNGTELTVSSGDSYQWYQNGTSIPSATNQTFEFNVLEYGAYAVDVTKKGCTSTSDEFIYLITGNEPVEQSLKVFPNPFKQEINISIPEGQIDFIELTDMTGRSIKHFPSGSTTLSTEDVSAGVYYVIIYSGKRRSHFRMTKVQ